jgi:hypothetical protein
MRTDPSDNGGLFVGRRPGTAPTRYGTPPQRAGRGRQRSDALLAHALLGLEVLVSLLFWGPVPVGALWLASRIQFWTGSVSLGILVGFLALIAVLLGGLMVLKRIDHAWVLVRRAAGIDQRQGAMGRVFGITAAVCAAAFSFWFIIINGPGSSAMPGQGP